jgi:hypothetical protein
VKLSDRQAMMLFQIAMDTLGLNWDRFRFSGNDRLSLVNEILSQQDTKVVDLREVK